MVASNAEHPTSKKDVASLLILLRAVGGTVFLDPGVRRGILRKSGALDGLEWESAVIGEVFKQVKTSGLPVNLFHLKTLDGRAVDLLLESEHGFIAIECKMTTNPSRNDFHAMRNLETLLDKPLLAGLVVCNDDAVHRLDADILLYCRPCRLVIVLIAQVKPNQCQYFSILTL